MKKFLFAFFAGILMTTIIFGGIVYFLLGPSLLMPPEKKAATAVDRPAVKTPTPGEVKVAVSTDFSPEEIVVEGKLDVPAPLRSYINPKASMSVTLGRKFVPAAAGQYLTMVDAIGNFPTTFKFSVPKNILLGWLKEDPQAETTLTLVYFPEGGPARFSKTALMARTRISAAKLASSPSKYDVGEIYFTQFQPYGGPVADPSVPCAKGSSAGKIIATQDFLSKAKPGTKYAYFFHKIVTPYFANPGEISKGSEIYSEGFFEPSLAGSPFTIPHDKFFVPGYFIGHVIACNEGEDLKSCASKRDLPWVESNDKDYRVFTLIPKGLQLGHCSSTAELTYYLHWFPPRGEIPKWISGTDRKLPPEILEGQML